MKEEVAEEAGAEQGSDDVVILDSSKNKSSKPKEDYYKSPTKEEMNQVGVYIFISFKHSEVSPII